MLGLDKTRQMSDIIHGSITYSGLEHEIISTPIFNRLHRVLQSSLVFLTFPANKVKRFEHSVGCMYLAGEIFFSGICNSSDEDFLAFIETVSNQLIEWRQQINFDKYAFVTRDLRRSYHGKEILKAPVPKCKLYNIYHPGALENDSIFTYFVVFQAVRIAGLLHDVGHLPYSHNLEQAIKKMYSRINKKENKTDIEVIFLNSMGRFVEGDDEIHEEIGKLLVNDIRNCIVQKIVDGSDPEIMFFLATLDFAEKILCSNPTDNTIYSDLHLIVSSVLDADRLDYCVRDAYCSGIDKSIILYDRLFSTYKMMHIKDDGSHFYFCPQAKMVSFIENLLERRFNIFSEINYHHRVHKHEILLEEVISMLGVEEFEAMNSIEDLPDALPPQVSSIWKLVSTLESQNGWLEYQIIQLDDSWLDTLLKRKFFEKYGQDYLSLRKNGNEILWNRFDEIISTTKHYHSFLKRAIDFREFDKLFFTELKHLLDASQKCWKYEGVIPNEKSHNAFYEKYHSFVFNYCMEKIYPTSRHRELFFENFENQLNQAVDKEDIHINDCLLRSCMFSFGYQTAKTPLYLWGTDGKPVKIDQISSKLSVFQKERALAPVFHIYYLPKYNSSINRYYEVDKTELMSILAKIAVKIMF